MQVMLMRLMSKGEYVKLGLNTQCIWKMLLGFLHRKNVIIFITVKLIC